MHALIKDARYSTNVLARAWTSFLGGATPTGLMITNMDDPAELNSKGREQLHAQLKVVWEKEKAEHERLVSEAKTMIELLRHKPVAHQDAECCVVQ